MIINFHVLPKYEAFLYSGKTFANKLLPHSLRNKVIQTFKHFWVMFQCYIACIILVSIAIIVYNRYCLTIRSLLGRPCSAFTNSWSISQTRSWRLADASHNQSSVLCADFICSHNFFFLFLLRLSLHQEDRRHSFEPFCHIPIEHSLSPPCMFLFRWPALMHFPRFINFSETKFRPAVLPSSSRSVFVGLLVWRCWKRDIKWISFLRHTPREISFWRIKI